MSSENCIINEVSYTNQTTSIYCKRKRLTNIILPIDNIITSIDCSQNLLSTLPLLNNNCTSICFKENRIKSVENLPQAITYLNLTRNRIQLFNFNILPATLTYLNISNNFIRNINYLPPNLETFICCNNKISLLNAELPNRLKIFKCCKNYLGNLPELPPTLEILACKSNNLTHLPNSLINCQNLVNLNYEKNERIIISEELLEFIDQVFQRQRAANNRGNNNTILIKNIYTDGQNVHDIQIASEVRNSIEKLMKFKLVVKTLNECLTEFEKYIKDNNLDKVDTSIYSTSIDKIKYLCNLQSRHSLLNVNFADVFIRIWNKIRISPYQKEIISILVQDLPEMMQVCFTGRLSRLVNCLSGFDNEISIKISEGQQIQTKYNVIAKKLSKLHDPNTIQYNIIFKYEFKKLLMEIDIEKDLIDVWIEPFHIEIEDFIEKIDKENIRILKDAINREYFENFIFDYNLWDLLDEE